jgi:hypothetical protein
MAFDLGGFFGGGLSGAAAGSALGPIGTIAGGLLGGIGGGLTGGGPAAYQLSPLQENLMNYGRRQVKASKSRRKSIVSQYQSLAKGGNRGAAEAFLESYRDRFSNPDFIENRLAKSYEKDIDYNRGGYWDVADELYRQQGLGFTGEDFGQFAEKAKAKGIRSSQAFGDMLRKDLIASGKVMTPQQEMLSYIFGAPARDETGRITNMYKKYVPLGANASTNA